MTKLTHFAFICLITGACIAPASGQTTLAPTTSTHETTTKTEPAASTSSAEAESFRVVPEDQLKQWWTKAANSSVPVYPRDAIVKSVQGCIAIAYAIHADGTTTPLKLIKESWTVADPAASKRLEQSTIGTVAQWHFAPAHGNAAHAPVLTYSIVTFTTTHVPANFPVPRDNQAASDRMKANCAVSDFAGDMQKMLGSPTSSSDAP